MGKPKNMPRKQRRTKKEILAAIKGTGGVHVHIAAKLGVARQTVANYRDRFPDVAQAIIEERAGISDAAISNIIRDIVTNKDVKTSQWWLMRRDPDFMDKQEVNVTTTTPIQFIKENRPNDSD